MIDALGLNGPGPLGADKPAFVLLLELVSGRVLSGVLEEAADAMASECSGDHGSLEDEVDAEIWVSDCSLDVDLRSPCPKFTERGLRGKEGLWLEEDGELDSLRLSALLKLHFFDGVLTTVGDVPATCTVG